METKMYDIVSNQIVIGKVWESADWTTISIWDIDRQAVFSLNVRPLNIQTNLVEDLKSTIINHFNLEFDIDVTQINDIAADDDVL